MAFGQGYKGYLQMGTAADPTGGSAPINLTPSIKNYNRDQQVELADQTTMQATGAAKSWLYGLNENGGTIDVLWDKAGVLWIALGDIIAAGQDDEDFNITLIDYPFGNTSGNLMVTRTVKFSGRNMKGGIANEAVGGTITYKGSGPPEDGTVD